jgi:hypothetical protein
LERTGQKLREVSMKQALIISGYDSTGFKTYTRFGVEDTISRIEETIETIFRIKEVQYVRIEGSCFVRKFHHEEN